MGREQRRKELKKKGKEVDIPKKKEASEIAKLLKTLAILLGTIVIIYFLVAIVITKEIDLFKPKENTVNNTSSVDKAILAKNIFRQKEDSYYVYFYDFNDKDSEIETSFINYLADSTIYRVNIKDAFNSNYIGESSNKNATTIEDLKVNGVTLLKIENDKIVTYIEGEKNIKESFTK